MSCYIITDGSEKKKKKSCFRNDLLCDEWDVALYLLLLGVIFKSKLPHFTAHRVFTCIDVQGAWLLLFINIL